MYDPYVTKNAVGIMSTPTNSVRQRISSFARLYASFLKCVKLAESANEFYKMEKWEVETINLADVQIELVCVYFNTFSVTDLHTNWKLVMLCFAPFGTIC